MSSKVGWQARVVAGHFAKTWPLTNPAFATRHLSTSVVWHLAGTISGTHASGTMRWSFAGPTKNACTPTNGHFTWNARKSGEGKLPDPRPTWAPGKFVRTPACEFAVRQHP
jgi:hypothetical protein